MKILIILIACFLSGYEYRCGGQGKDKDSKPLWTPLWLRDTLTRDIGCPLMAIGIMLLYGIPLNWFFLLFLLLSWIALTTYWDEIFGYDNFYFHGLGCGLAGLVLWGVVPWEILIARLIICPLGMGIGSKLVKRDVPQEIIRGIFFIL